jgi:acetate kinase
MDANAVVLVLNAGSSSLKFSVYGAPQADVWQLAARGQIEGIGTSPRLSVRDDAGGVLAAQALDGAIRDGRGAIDFLATWLRSRWAGRAPVVGVGHRVVHGGARYTGPTVVTPEILEDLRNWFRWRRFISRITSRQPRPFSNGFREVVSPASMPAFMPASPQSPGSCPCQLRSAPGVALRISRAVAKYIASVLPGTAPELAGGRVIVAHGSGARRAR